MLIHPICAGPRTAPATRRASRRRLLWCNWKDRRFVCHLRLCTTIVTIEDCPLVHHAVPRTPQRTIHLYEICPQWIFPLLPWLQGNPYIPCRLLQGVPSHFLIFFSFFLAALAPVDEEDERERERRDLRCLRSRESDLPLRESRECEGFQELS